jgi:hypothetical protein
MGIAQVAPLCERVPAPLYGGTERVVSYLTGELVGLGHEVTSSRAEIRQPPRSRMARDHVDTYRRVIQAASLS